MSSNQLPLRICIISAPCFFNNILVTVFPKQSGANLSGQTRFRKMKDDDLILVVPVKAEMLWISFPVGRHHLQTSCSLHTRFIGSLNLSNCFVLLRFDGSDQTEYKSNDLKWWSVLLITDCLIISITSNCYSGNLPTNAILFNPHSIYCHSPA